MSFRVDPRLKNLLLDISDGYGISMTELLLMMALKEAGVESLDDFDG
jgi:antitoxin component of RelBE/YafQ-DinJ toxin-antitoxin module